MKDLTKPKTSLKRWVLCIILGLFVWSFLNGMLKDKQVDQAREELKSVKPDYTQSIFDIGNKDGLHVETLCANPAPKPEGINFVIKDGEGYKMAGYTLYFAVDPDGNSPITNKGWRQIKLDAPGQMTMTEAFFMTAFELKDTLDNGTAKVRFAITKGVPPKAGDAVWTIDGGRLVMYGAGISLSPCSTLSK